MATIRINITIGELMIEFTDTKDLERQLENIDLSKKRTGMCLFEKLGKLDYPFKEYFTT
jgi:hypothetical protein